MAKPLSILWRISSTCARVKHWERGQSFTNIIQYININAGPLTNLPHSPTNHYTKSIRKENHGLLIQLGMNSWKAISTAPHPAVSGILLGKSDMSSSQHLPFCSQPEGPEGRTQSSRKAVTVLSLSAANMDALWCPPTSMSYVPSSYMFLWDVVRRMFQTYHMNMLTGHWPWSADDSAGLTSQPGKKAPAPRLQWVSCPW